MNFDIGATKETIISDRVPAAIGPYSHAVKAGGMIYVSGCIGISKETSKLVEGGVREQAIQCLENMKCIVEDAGSSMSKVVKCTVLLTDMNHFSEVNKVYAEYFVESFPARACFAVLALPAGALVEIEAICIE